MKAGNWKEGALLFALSLVVFLLLNSAGMVMAAADDVAIEGYDSVAYFKDNEAKKGSKSHTVRWHDKIWYFSSEQHQELFASNPQEYAPQFDGYCAWAMTEDRIATTDPEVWKIVDGKLYLNCSLEAYEKWRQDIPGHIREANANWAERKEKE